MLFSVKKTGAKKAEGEGESLPLFADISDPAPKPRAKRKQRAPLDHEALRGSDIHANWNAGARHDASRKRAQSKALPPSTKQKAYLAALMGYPGIGVMTDFVRFANGYWNEEITRVHYKHAIDLMVKGYNVYGTAEYLVELSL